jgi:hypothetical protein
MTAATARYRRLCAPPRLPGARRRRDHDTFLEQVTGYTADLARDVTAGDVDPEEAATRLIECGYSRRGAEATVDRWLGRDTWTRGASS